MKKLFVVAMALSLAACSTIRAEQAGKSYTCIPNDAMNRGPFEPTPAKGALLTVTSGEPLTVASEK